VTLLTQYALAIPADHALPIAPPTGALIAFANTAGGTVYYNDSLPVSASVNQGSVTVGGSVTLTRPMWLIASTAPTGGQVSVLSLDSVLTPSSQSGTAYTLQATDAGTAVEFTNASAITVTVPPNVFTPGQWVNLCQLGAGQVGVVAGGGVTIRSDSGLTHCANQYAELSLRCRASNDFVLSGDLA
jgi:hypothetical protein